VKTKIDRVALGRLGDIQKRIDATECESIPDRWEFGHELLKQVPEGKKQLPKGVRAEITEKYKLESSEITRRMQLADKFATREEVVDACTSCTSWRQVIREVLPKSPPRVKVKTWRQSTEAKLYKIREVAAESDENYADLKQLVADLARAMGWDVREMES
jgi:hypothetical protein